jgi:hypothetical protein
MTPFVKKICVYDLFGFVLSLKPSQGTGSLLDLRVLTQEGRACTVFSYCETIFYFYLFPTFSVLWQEYVGAHMIMEIRQAVLSVS